MIEESAEGPQGTVETAGQYGMGVQVSARPTTFLMHPSNERLQRIDCWVAVRGKMHETVPPCCNQTCMHFPQRHGPSNSWWRHEVGTYRYFAFAVRRCKTNFYHNAGSVEINVGLFELTWSAQVLKPLRMPSELLHLNTVESNKNGANRDRDRDRQNASVE